MGIGLLACPWLTADRMLQFEGVLQYLGVVAILIQISCETLLPYITHMFHITQLRSLLAEKGEMNCQ